MTVSKSLRALAAVTCLLIASTATAQKVKKPIALNEREIDKELAAVLEKGRKMEDLQRLQRIGTKIRERGRCQPHWVDAKNTYESLERLNRQYQNRRVDRRYQQEEKTLRNANTAARKAYQDCFTIRMKQRDRWTERGVIDYHSFKAMFTNLSVELRGHTAQSLKRRAEQLYAQKQKLKNRNVAPVALLSVLSGDVRTTRNGSPIRLREGSSVYPGDSFANGSNGRARLAFNEVVGNAKRGPYHVSIGPNTTATVTGDSMTKVANRKDKGKIKLGIELTRGSIRLLNPGAGFGSRYVVSVGKFSVLALGSDTVVSHYPRRSITNIKLQGGVVDIARGSKTVASLRPPSQLTIRRGVVQKTRELPFDQWLAAIEATGEQTKAKAPPPRKNPGKGIDRAGVNRRAAARVAVDRMLQAMSNADANGLLTATTGQAQRNARTSLRNSSLRDVLRKTGRPVQWRHDCVACTSDGYCGVPTEVIVDGGPGRYDAMHVVKPANGGRTYTVDRIDPWNEDSQKFFNNHRPLCEAEVRHSERR